MTPPASRIATSLGAWSSARTVVAIGTLVLGLAYAATLLPGVRDAAGFSVPLDGWLNGVFRAAVIAVLVLRGFADRTDRLAWWLLAAGLGAALLGTLGYYLHYQYQDPVPYPSLSDVGFVAFYGLAYVALFLLLGRRVRGLHRSVWLDGLVAGVAAAAFAAAFFFELSVDPAQGSRLAVATTLAYPVADVLLLMVVVGAVAVIGRGAGAMWWWLTAGFLAFAISDALYVQALAAGTFTPGGWLDLGWTVARLCFVAAALQPARSRHVTALRGTSVLVVPGICAVAALALLFYGSQVRLQPWADMLAVCAVLAALLRMALTFREVEALREMGRQATVDELTGLANRRAFYAALRDTAASGRTFAVLMLDLDRFKDVNDSLGHHIGDELLRMAARRLSDANRGEHFLARLGGDEFALLALEAGAADAEAVARRMRAELQAPFVLGPARLTIDASAGIALAPRDSADADELLQMADLAMYAAKRRRAGVLSYDPGRDERGRHRLELADQLRSGIADGQLDLAYQPKLDIRRGVVDGVEALVRWRHPTRGLLGPGEFIDVAESSGLMRQMTAAVLDEALRQCRRWRDDGIELTVAVNISPSDLSDDALALEVRDALSRHALPASSLILEMTEHILMEDRATAATVLTGLRATGAGISIDDFGTGYSSLAYLADLPVTELKLDRSLVARMTVSERYTEIVRSTVSLTHALGMKVVAEGVEDEPTLEALARAGCDRAQGYHLSRPVSGAAIAEIIAGGRLPNTVAR